MPLSGAASVRAAHRRIVVQDPEASVVYGMPKAVVDMGLADLQVPLEELASALASKAPPRPQK